MWPLLLPPVKAKRTVKSTKMNNKVQHVNFAALQRWQASTADVATTAATP
jgi:hypothetical protein